MEFEHVGNALCLELSNSVPDRTESGERDWLRSPNGAADWARSLELATDEEPSTEDLGALTRLRESIFEVFTALADGAHPDDRELRTITEAHVEGLRRYGYTMRGEAIVRDWPQRWDTSALIAVFADSAVSELTGDRLDRVKSCPSCRWLFFDTSRNRSRRWCSMQTCGGRDKALRHYRKQRT